MDYRVIEEINQNILELNKLIYDFIRRQFDLVRNFNKRKQEYLGVQNTLNTIGDIHI